MSRKAAKKTKPSRPRAARKPAAASAPSGIRLPMLGDPHDIHIAREIERKVLEAKRIVVLGHERPDGDCVGSTVALGMALKALGRDVHVLLEPKLPVRFKYLFEPGEVRPKQKGQSTRRYPADLAIVLDTTDVDRISGLVPAQIAGITIVNIDHHMSNNNFGDLNWVDTSAAAAGELVYRLTSVLGWAVPPVALDALYTALMTDTGQFAYSNTTPRVLRMAAELLAAGVDGEELWRRLYLDKSRAELDLEARARTSLEVWANGQISCITLTQADFEKTGTGPQMTQEFPGIPRALAGSKLAVFFYAVNGGKDTKVSIRSVKELDACALAKRFGGGGHRQAAGCTIPLPMKEAKDLFRPAAEKMLKEHAALGTAGKAD